MRRYSKIHNTIVYIIAFILCIVIILCLFLYLTQHTQTYSKSDDIQKYTTMINTNLSIWMGVIAAICTLLPLASNFYQAAQAEKIKEDVEKKMRDNMNKSHNRLRVLNQHVEKLNSQISRQSDHIGTLSKLTLLHNDVNAIRELQELQNKNTNLTLVDNAYLRTLINSIESLSQIDISTLNHEFTEIERAAIINSVVNVLNSYRSLLRSLEAVAHGDALYHTIELQDTISMNISRITCENQSDSQGDRFVHTAVWHISHVSKLCLQLITDIRNQKSDTIRMATIKSEP